jgi:hypothetical protein
MRCALRGVDMRNRVLYAWLALAVFGGQKVAAQQDAPRVPMKEVYEDGAEARWLNKKVLESQVLDSMEDAATWTFHGDGEMALADSPVKDGKHSLRIRSTQNIGKVGGAGEWEDLIASRKSLPKVGAPTTGFRSGSIPTLSARPRFRPPWCCTTRARTCFRTVITRGGTSPSF